MEEKYLDSKMQNNSVEEKVEKKIPTFLKNARAVKEWIEKSGDTKPPIATSKDLEESKLGSYLAVIRKNLIKPYNNLKTEEEKRVYREKHPELDEVIEIVEEIDRNNIPAHLRNAMAIREWIKTSKYGKKPSPASRIPEERRLGNALSSIRQVIIKPYNRLKTDEERRLFIEKHPETEEVIKIVEEIDRNDVPVHLRNARALKEWIKINGGAKLPDSQSEDMEEQRLANAYNTIRQILIKPYKLLETENAREMYKEKHPELEEVMKIIEEIENIKRQKLNNLIEEYETKNEELEKYKKMEVEYDRIKREKMGNQFSDRKGNNSIER